MFADDTQLFNRPENSIKEVFESLAKYEKASGSKVNYKKTLGLYIGRWKNKIPIFNRISWTKCSVKTLGIHHGYNVNDHDIWRKLIAKLKSCTQVWKTRNLSFEGKVQIVKSLLLSTIGYEIEIRGIPNTYILSNKRNAPYRKLNHKFSFTVKVFMNIDVRYKYDKTFESTIKLRDYWTMTFLNGD